MKNWFSDAKIFRFQYWTLYSGSTVTIVEFIRNPLSAIRNLEPAFSTGFVAPPRRPQTLFSLSANYKVIHCIT
jgi:hypothetical protein